MRWCKKTDRDRRSKKVKAKFLPSSISFSCCFSFSLFRLHFCFRARADSLCNEASLSLSLSLLHEGLQGFNMSEPNGGGVPSGDGRLDGLAGGAASADDDTARMPPPPPRLKKPLEASLNPLLVGATVVSASGPPPQRLNVRCCCVFESVVEQGEEKERGGASSNIPKRTKKNQKKKTGRLNLDLDVGLDFPTGPGASGQARPARQDPAREGVLAGRVAPEVQGAARSVSFCFPLSLCFFFCTPLLSLMKNRRRRAHTPLLLLLLQPTNHNHQQQCPHREKSPRGSSPSTPRPTTAGRRSAARSTT